jgi:hypothetical protein
MRNSKEKRQHIRYSLIGEQVKWMPKDNIHGPEMVEIHDISDRASSLRVLARLSLKAPYSLSLNYPETWGL